jgi:putative peptidoglycan lipid II flippase
LTLLKTIATTGLLTSLGFVASFASLIAISYFFGASEKLDAYWAAFAVMNVLASLAAPMREALVPDYHRRLQRDEKDAKRYFSQAMTLILCIAFGGMLLGLLFPDFFASLVVNANNPGLRSLSVYQIYWLAPGIVLLVISETLNALLAAYNKVVFQSLARLLGAISSVCVLLTVAGALGSYALPIAFLTAQTITVFLQGHVLYRAGLRFSFSWPRLDRKFFAISGSLLLSYVASQLYVIIEKNTLTFFEAGLVSSFQYAVSLTNVIVTMVGITMSSVLWPRMMKYVATDEHESLFEETLLTSRLILFALGVFCGLIWLNATSIVTLLFARGAFVASDIPKAANALQIAVFASIPISIGFVVGKGLVSFGAARSLMTTGLTIAVVGSVTLLLANSLANETLALAHWVVANSVGLAVQMLLLKKLCKNMQGEKQRAFWWLVRWSAAMVIALLCANAIDQASSEEYLKLIECAFYRSAVFLAAFGLVAWSSGLCREYKLMFRH